ncbi:unnamed protein product [Clonostachys solani]|uniref:Uncharacterized protein n=1 Tax=Clonostachys solani TaxID=160281 RepID=A0A9N9ZGM5_9HYPO|nr:unnamed protein product [Clonostachys solani]
MQFSNLAAIAVLGLASLTTAHPHKRSVDLVEALKILAPKSVSCASAKKPDECRTAEQAAPFLEAGFKKYGLVSDNAKAAALGLVSLESGDFQYKRNAFPGRPGQGTVNMQMPNFNLEYARSIPELAPQVANITTTEGLSDAELNRMLGLLVESDEYNFASVSWFVKWKCPEVRCALAKDVNQGYRDYMACVEVDPDNEERMASFKLAKQAFGITA